MGNGNLDHSLQSSVSLRVCMHVYARNSSKEVFTFGTCKECVIRQCSTNVWKRLHATVGLTGILLHVTDIACEARDAYSHLLLCTFTKRESNLCFSGTYSQVNVYRIAALLEVRTIELSGM